MIEELNNARDTYIKDRQIFRDALKSFLKEHGKNIQDLAAAVSKTSEKKDANISSRISSGYIDDKLWEYIEFYLRSLTI